MSDIETLLGRLADHDVAFIVVGGVAAILHGSARVTYDLDVVYARDPENLEALAAALADLNPYLRDAPPGLPFTLDAATLAHGLNFTLSTDRGPLDLLGEIVGGGTYEDLLPTSRRVDLGFGEFRVLELEKLIDVKRAAGRPKDLEAIAELETLADAD